jgi:Holliday junction resolvase RusA-like endonuclease
LTAVTLNIFKAYFTNKTHADCMNLSKGLLDALQNVVYLNDRQIKKGTIEVFEGYPDDSFIVEITPYHSV